MTASNQDHTVEGGGDGKTEPKGLVHYPPNLETGILIVVSREF